MPMSLTPSSTTIWVKPGNHRTSLSNLESADAPNTGTDCSRHSSRYDASTPLVHELETATHKHYGRPFANTK